MICKEAIAVGDLTTAPNTVPVSWETCGDVVLSRVAQTRGNLERKWAQDHPQQGANSRLPALADGSHQSSSDDAVTLLQSWTTTSEKVLLGDTATSK